MTFRRCHPAKRGLNLRYRYTELLVFYGCGYFTSPTSPPRQHHVLGLNTSASTEYNSACQTRLWKGGGKKKRLQNHLLLSRACKKPYREKSATGGGYKHHFWSSKIHGPVYCPLPSQSDALRVSLETPSRVSRLASNSRRAADPSLSRHALRARLSPPLSLCLPRSPTRARHGWWHAP